MRVIAGTARSRKLAEVPGMASRPTTDKVKESIFNIIQWDVEGRRVLDLFAGTGQLGIEALSRGADRCVFVDAAKEAVRVVKENVKTTGFENQSRIVQGDALSFLLSCREKFGVVLLDPPYAADLLSQVLERITAIDIVTENGIIVCESDAETILPEVSAPYQKGKEYRYGRIKLTLYHRLPAQA